MDPTYNWKRFWYKRGDVDIITEQGYLTDPEPEYMFFHREKLKQLNELEENPCLILLGEPGIGKSDSMAKAAKSKQKLAGQSTSVIHQDLKPFSSESSIYRNIFDLTEFKEWKESSNGLYLYLDSLDECLTNIKTLPEFLLEELKKLDLKRLHLRIACKSARWPIPFENKLARLWGSDNVQVYHLAPLRRCDVSCALDCEEIPSVEFLNKVDDFKAVPLAVSPITLKLLIKTYKARGEIAHSRKEIYESGCKELAKETKLESVTMPESFRLSEVEKFQIAARIAAITVFSRKHIISLDRDHFAQNSSYLYMTDFNSGSEKHLHEKIEVNRVSVSETLNTGLFISCGQNLFTWAHQCYSHFLAAYYLASSNITTNEILKLIILPNNPEPRIVDQLHQVAAWLACFDANIFSRISQIDSQVLLKSDLTQVDDAAKFHLVESIISQFENENIIDDDWSIQYDDYKGLKNNRLASQLKPYFLDNQTLFMTRRFLIDLVSSCQIQELYPELVKIALDQHSNYYLRIRASWCIARSSFESHKKQLLPLAMGLAGEDPEDELKGYGLQSVWPKHISAEQLFKLLDKPQCPNLIGGYRSFLDTDLAAHVKSKDLPYALSWVARQPYLEEVPPEFKKLTKLIIAKAWKELGDDIVLSSFAETILKGLKKLNGFRYCLICENDDDYYKIEITKRHRLIEYILKNISKLEKHDVSLTDLFNFRDPIVIKDDIPWVLDQVIFTETKSRGFNIWINLLSELLKQFPYEYPNETLTAYHQSILMKETFKDLFDPIPLCSTLAKKLKTNYYENLKPIRQRRKIKKADLLSAEQFFQLFFSHIENNSHSVWMNLAVHLKFDEQDVICKNSFSSHHEVELIWSQVEESIKSKLIEQCEKCVLITEPKSEEWFLENSYRYEALALYVSLQILSRVNPVFLNTLSSEVWAKCSPIILRSPFQGANKTSEIHENLILKAYQGSPDTFVSWLLKLLEHEDRENQNIYAIYRIENCFDEYLVDHLIKKIKTTDFSNNSLSQILSILFKSKHPKPFKFALELLNEKPVGSKDVDLHRIVAKSLFKYGNENTWNTIWLNYFDNGDLGKELMTEIAQESSFELRSIPHRLSEIQLSNLFIWLEKCFPSSEDPEVKTDRIHRIESRESIKDFKSSVFNTLRSMGSKEACRQIEKIIKVFPKYDWLRWQLVIAKRAMRIQAWEPIAPSNLIEITENKSKRIIRCEADLLDVIVESLERFESKMQHTVTPISFVLWNNNKGVFSPKLENKLSDLIKVFLIDDICNQKIVVNREVEIASAKDRGMGESLDVFIEAFLPPSHEMNVDSVDKICAIIEVKGCWNRDVLTGLENQLFSKYLVKTGVKTGLYVVGYYFCDAWDREDDKFKRTYSVLKSPLSDCRAYFSDLNKSNIPSSFNVKTVVLDLRLRD